MRAFHWGLPAAWPNRPKPRFTLWAEWCMDTRTSRGCKAGTLFREYPLNLSPGLVRENKQL